MLWIDSLCLPVAAAWGVHSTCQSPPKKSLLSRPFHPALQSINSSLQGAHYVRNVAKAYGVPVVLHSDHCAKKLLPWFDGMLKADEEYFKANGEPLFSSHMIDLSEEPLNENIELCVKYMQRMVMQTPHTPSALNSLTTHSRQIPIPHLHHPPASLRNYTVHMRAAFLWRRSLTLHPLFLSLFRQAKINCLLEMELGITGGEEDGVNNEHVDNDSMYSTPEEVWQVYKALDAIPKAMFTIAAAFGNVHGVYKPGNVVLKPEILDNCQKVR